MVGSVRINPNLIIKPAPKRPKYQRRQERLDQYISSLKPGDTFLSADISKKFFFSGGKEASYWLRYRDDIDTVQGAGHRGIWVKL